MQIYTFLQFLACFHSVLLITVPFGYLALSSQETTEKPAENEVCMDDGRLMDTSVAGAMVALIIIFIWHVLRIFCISRMAAAHHPPPEPQPKESMSSTNTARAAVTEQLIGTAIGVAVGTAIASCV
uniref:DUF4149 domain-containing protein n=1 Tax=Meloidogyne hapla TaxID=6305 RepID=A0A1I8BMU0_MELHA